MLQRDEPDDYVIATGESFSLKEFVIKVFSCLDLDWQRYLETNEEFLRPTDIDISLVDPSKAAEKLGWKVKYNMNDVVEKMIEAEIKGVIL